MDLKIVCGTWIKEDDEKVLNVLQASDKWLSDEELSEITGLSTRKVAHTMRMLKQQMGFYEGRKRFLSKE